MVLYIIIYRYDNKNHFGHIKERYIKNFQVRRRVGANFSISLLSEMGPSWLNINFDKLIKELFLIFFSWASGGFIYRELVISIHIQIYVYFLVYFQGFFLLFKISLKTSRQKNNTMVHFFQYYKPYRYKI